jgi:hypothetical protein
VLRIKVGVRQLTIKILKVTLSYGIEKEFEGPEIEDNLA